MLFFLLSASDDHSTEKSSKFSLRLGGTGMRKSSSQSHRPSTPSGSPNDFISAPISVPTQDSSFREKDTKEKDADAAKREPATLRKRTVSAPHTSPGISTSPEGFSNGVSGAIKQGKNIFEQIGEPDHFGWMRKRGDRYNAWKLRYFVLKGPHMYILRSDNKTVCFPFLFLLLRLWSIPNRFFFFHFRSKRESKDIFILLDIKLLWTKVLTQDDMGSGSIMTTTRRITSALRRRPLFAIG